MRNKNRYQRNRQAKIKAWKRAVKIEGGLYSHKFSFPSWNIMYGRFKDWDIKEQLKDRENFIKNWWVRSFLCGNKKGFHNCSKEYRKIIERCERRHIKKSLNDIIYDVNNADDYNIPSFKHDGNFTWF